MEIGVLSEYIALPDQTDFQMHSHTGYEIFCFLEGDADFMVEGTRYRLTPGDLLLMRQGESHHIVFRSPAPYYRIVVSFATLAPLGAEMEARLLRPFRDRSAGEYNRYAFADFSEKNLRFYMDRLAAAQDEEQKFCFLLPLLSELSDAFPILREANAAEKHHAISSIVEYINLHVCEPLTIERLCKQFYISRTHINRQFKKITGATVWEYITVKRLFLARERMTAGTPPTKVYAECGFRDYTTFFRAYKKHFHASPRQIERQ